MIKYLFKKKEEINNNPFTQSHIYDANIYKSRICVKCKQLLDSANIQNINDDIVKVTCSVCGEEMIFKNWGVVNV